MLWEEVLAIVENCTLIQNIASQSGGGLAEIYDCNTVLTNTILWDNTPLTEQIYINDGPSYPNRMEISFSMIAGDLLGVHDPNTRINWGPGNIDDNPEFAFPLDGHLLAGSPCIDKGTPDINMPQLTDPDGSPRVIDGDNDGQAQIDMGVYEFDSSSPIVALSTFSIQLQGTAGTAVGPSTLLQLRNAGSGTLSWQIQPSEDWIQVIPAHGIVDGQIANIEVQIDPSGLAGGHYQTQLTVIAPDAVNSPQKVIIDLHLSGTLYVPSQHSTIQAAIDAADDGDTVLVADGLYRGLGNRDIQFNGKAILLKSENGPQNCIIDVEGSEEDPHRAFVFLDSYEPETNDSVIEGFTLTGGHAGLNFFKIFPPFDGGAISCYSSGTVVRHCLIENNDAYGSGGAVFYYWGIDMPDRSILENCILTYN